MRLAGRRRKPGGGGRGGGLGTVKAESMIRRPFGGGGFVSSACPPCFCRHDTATTRALSRQAGGISVRTTSVLLRIGRSENWGRTPLCEVPHVAGNIL